MNSKSTEIQTLFDTLGRSEIRGATGKTLQAMTNVITRGKIPPSWYFELLRLGEQKGVKVSSELFGDQEGKAA
jgi:hypothetical protein